MTNGFERYSKKTRRALFLEEMGQVAPWGKLCGLIEPLLPEGGQRAPAGGRGAHAARRGRVEQGLNTPVASKRG
jgi:hypothetical protein